MHSTLTGSAWCAGLFAPLAVMAHTARSVCDALCAPLVTEMRIPINGCHRGTNCPFLHAKKGHVVLVSVTTVLTLVLGHAAIAIHTKSFCSVLCSLTQQGIDRQKVLFDNKILDLFGSHT
jgi:hypothetical protein